jgi:hypothetical protein
MALAPQQQTDGLIWGGQAGNVGATRATIDSYTYGVRFKSGISAS